ncbi:beta strand repeat-containing protein [Rhizobium rhizoryzae]|uniref:beta strand repeat-containing protein n=1 Tax=Rhizobium rhizoryzae TaxID=451876 RepID=UPI0028A2D64F|nr:DUF4214 domain-containing protein [Rhizobium rhizoryzae]
MASIQGVYVALFGRPADPTGLAYFNGVTNNGANLNAIGNLASTSEYQARFAGQSNTQIITTIYQSLFNRAPEAAGLNFFVDALNKGTLSINNIAIAILDGAQGSDKTLVDKKIAAADLFTKELDTPVEVGNYTGLTAASKGVAYLSAVTATSATPTAATAAAAVLTLGTDSGVAGVTISLATANDVVAATAANPALKSTAGDDTIVGGATYAATNIIDAGAGTDKLTASLGANVTVAENGLKNLEQAFIKATAAGITFAAAEAKQLTQVWNDASGAGNDLTVTGINKTVTVGLKGSVDASTFTFNDVAGTSDTATLALDKAVVAGGSTTIAGIETLTVANTGASAVDLTVADTTTLNVSGTGDLNVALTTATKLATVDASALNGGLTINVSATDAVASVKGGLLGDTITVDAAGNTAALTVDGGAGADTLIVANGVGNNFTVSLTGGAGPDTFRFSDLNNVKTATAADLTKSLVTITDFDKSVDTIDVKGMGAGATAADRVVLTGTELANIASKGTLFEAVQTAAGIVNSADKFAVFVWGTDAYIYNDNAAAGLTDGDGLIKITGVTNVADLTTTNFLVA